MSIDRRRRSEEVSIETMIASNNLTKAESNVKTTAEIRISSTTDTDNQSTYDVITTSATSGYSTSDCHDNGHDVQSRHRPRVVTSEAARKGALLLGSGDDVYTTRYCIDHEAQTSGLCAEVLYEECVPCCHHSTRTRASRWVWAFLRSEAFVYFLHITSIVFGVAKEAVGVTREDPFLTILHTGIETGATLLLLIIRLVGGRDKEKVVAEAIADLEYVDQSEPDTHVRKVQVYINLHTAFSALLILICVGSFVLFLLIDELGWTLLSNNFCMITTNVVSGLLFTRVSLALVTIREDQFKVTIFESLALIEDLSEAAETLEQGGNDTGRAEQVMSVFDRDQSAGDDIEHDIKFILDDTSRPGKSGSSRVKRKKGKESKSENSHGTKTSGEEQTSRTMVTASTQGAGLGGAIVQASTGVNNHSTVPRGGRVEVGGATVHMYDNYDLTESKSKQNPNQSDYHQHHHHTKDKHIKHGDHHKTSNNNNNTAGHTHHRDKHHGGGGGGGGTRHDEEEDVDMWWVSNDISRIEPAQRSAATGRVENLLVVEVKTSTSLETKPGEKKGGNLTSHESKATSKEFPPTTVSTTNAHKENSGKTLADDDQPTENLTTTVWARVEVCQQYEGGGGRRRTFEEVEQQARRFLEAVEATPLFHQPTHIDVYDMEKERVKNIKELHHQRSASTNTYL